MYRQGTSIAELIFQRVTVTNVGLAISYVVLSSRN